MRDRLFWTAPCLLAWCGLLYSAVGSPEETIVIANKNNARSEEVARYYMEQRGIPSANLCILNLPLSESMSRSSYEKRLRDPLLTFLRKGLFIDQVARDRKTIKKHETAWTTTRTSVRYLVSMYGVPLRIKDTRTWLATELADHLRRPAIKDTAAVDSELSMLFWPPYSIRGAVMNPRYRLHSTSGKGGVARLLLAATRLDGPNPDTVRRMIDDALYAEQYGLHGNACFDENAAADNYKIGDQWLRKASEHFARQGHPLIRDLRAEEWGASATLDDVAVYMGWYAAEVMGPFADEAFSFQRGAVAYHIYSGSARTLRSSTKYWAGPLLARGAAVTMGAVEEPFLTLTPDLGTFASHLCAGETFADSAYASMTHLSWQITVVGDPLYRPYRYTLDRQVENMERDKRPSGERDKAYVRKVRRLVRNTSLEKALQFAEEKLSEESLPALSDEVVRIKKKAQDKNAH